MIPAINNAQYIAYWKDRMLEAKISSMAGARKQIRLMQRTFRDATEDIRRAADDILASADGNLAKAKEVLSVKELAALRGQYKELVEQSLGTGAQAQKAELLLSRLYNNQRVERMDAQLAQIDLLSAQLHEKISTGLAKGLTDGAKNSYYRVFHALETSTGQGWEWNKINARQLNILVSENWSGIHWSERLWGHIENFDQRLKDIITNGVLTGSSTKDMALQLKSVSGRSQRETETLIRTEMAHISEQAAGIAYEETGVTRYKFLAELDFKTSEICRRLDGQDFAVADRVIGENYPPMHPNCRSTTVPYFEGEESVGTRAARDPKTGRRIDVPADWDYEKWYAERIGSVLMPSMRGGGGAPVTHKQIVEASRSLAARFEAEASNHAQRMGMYARQATFEQTNDPEKIFMYSTGSDTILYNPEHPSFVYYDLKQALTHELAHMADYNYYRSWEDADFTSAMQNTARDISGKKAEIESWFAPGGKYYGQGFIGDTFSALLFEGNIDIDVAHNTKYYKYKPYQAMEILANMTSIEMFDLPGRQEFGGLLTGLYEAFQRLTGGALT